MRAQIASFLLILPALVQSVRIPEDWQVEEAKEAILEAIEEDQDFGPQILRLGNCQIIFSTQLGEMLIHTLFFWCLLTSLPPHTQFSYPQLVKSNIIFFLKK